MDGQRRGPSGYGLEREGAVLADPRILRQQVSLIPGRVEVLVVVHDLAFQAGARDEVVHAIDRPEEGRFAAAGRPDQCRDLVRRHIE